MKVPILLTGGEVSRTGREGGVERRLERQDYLPLFFFFFYLAAASPNEKITAHAEFIAISFSEVVHGFPEDGPYIRQRKKMRFLRFNSALKTPNVQPLIGTCARPPVLPWRNHAREKKKSTTRQRASQWFNASTWVSCGGFAALVNPPRRRRLSRTVYENQWFMSDFPNGTKKIFFFVVSHDRMGFNPFRTTTKIAPTEQTPVCDLSTHWLIEP